MTISSVPQQQIPVFKPLLGQEEIDAAVEALEMGWLGMGSYVGEFEKELGRVSGASDRHVVALSTGHAAIHLGLLVAGVGPGDEVITPSFNNIADLQAILATGADPVFCDIDDHSLCIDVEKAATLVTPRTKAIIAMDYACMLCDHDAVQELAARHGLRVIHDAAHSIGSLYKGRPVGSFSDITMFSFDPVKTITCIDGGALVVQTEEEATELREMRLIGMGQSPELMYQDQRAWTYDVKRLGFRYHMANLHARIGLTQIAKLDSIVETRRETCRRYHHGLAGIPDLRLPQTDFSDIAPFIYYVRVPADVRQSLRDHLALQGVDTGIHWQPAHWFSLFRDARRDDLTVTEKVGCEVLTIPLHSEMPHEQTAYVIETLTAFFA